jgi:hypothetical protein
VPLVRSPRQSRSDEVPKSHQRSRSRTPPRAQPTGQVPLVEQFQRWLKVNDFETNG